MPHSKSDEPTWSGHVIDEYLSLWTIKYSTSMFLRSLTESVRQKSHQKLLRYLHIFLGATFIATVIADLGACHPFSHYWQVTPDPGAQCRQGYAHLITTGVLNIVTNLAIIIFPIPMILKSRLPQAQYVPLPSPETKQLTTTQDNLHPPAPQPPNPQHSTNALPTSPRNRVQRPTTLPLARRLFRHPPRDLHI